MNKLDTILLVDDQANNLRALKLDLEETPYRTLTACDGQEAWEIIQKEGGSIAAILLDRMMPRMNGMEFMKILKASSFSHIPVIMQTAAAEKEQVVEGIQAGVYYYLTKPYDKHIMLSILYAAIKDHRYYSDLRININQFHNKLDLVKTITLQVQTLDDTEYLATFLARLFPDPERVVLGISELVLNALEHGNLGITYDEKGILIKEGKLHEELKRRQTLPENKDKSVLITYTKMQDHIELRIKDEGNGFDWKDYMEISPERATHNHGRGIAMSKMISFDEITYIGPGNEVLCKTVHSTAQNNQI